MLSLPTLSVGVDDAELVWDLQRFLHGLGFSILVDGKFGLKTRATVQKYQQEKRIATDGLVGPTTWGHLLADGFRPSQFEEPSASIYGPPKPPGARAPNGRVLFGSSFRYEPKPLPSMPEYVQPDPDWVRDNITSVEIPELQGVAGAPKSLMVTFNKQLTYQLQTLFRLIPSNQVLTWAGSYVPRFVRGSQSKLSNHSFGSAFDINATWNGYRKQPALRGQKGSVREFVLLAYDLGFYWGGWYNDGMHFEAYQAMTTEEVNNIRGKYERNA